MKKLRIAVPFSGSASSLRFLYENDPECGNSYEFVCGIANKKDTVGEKFCIQNNIDFVHLNTKQFCVNNGYTGQIWNMSDVIRDSYFNEFFRAIKLYEPDIILLSGFMLEIPERFLHYRLIVNVHPADLRIQGITGKPKFTGDNAVVDAINAGEKFTASTIHVVEKEVDCGRIICVSDPLPVLEGVTSKEHQEKMKTLCDGPAYMKALQLIIRGESFFV